MTYIRTIHLGSEWKKRIKRCGSNGSSGSSGTKSGSSGSKHMFEW